MTPMIAVSQLKKHFHVARRYPGTWGMLRALFSRQVTLVRAVDGISFTVQPGELVGYLGPNGAGKSTTIKMLTGLLAPTSGEARVKGFVPWRERQKYVAHIGAVFGQRTTLWWDLPVIESLDLLRHIYRIPADRFKQRMTEFRQLLDLDPFLNNPVRTLSLGQRMRADLCAAMIHEPSLLFLDEPTIGLDVVAKERIRQFIVHINRQHGTTIVLTTHDLSDVVKLCERAMIIDHGQLLYDGSLMALHEKFGGKRQLMVIFSEHYPEVDIEGAEIIAHDGLRVTYCFERGKVAVSDLIGRLSARYRIQDLEVREPEIEDTIRRIYEERLLEP